MDETTKNVELHHITYFINYSRSNLLSKYSYYPEAENLSVVVVVIQPLELRSMGFLKIAVILNWILKPFNRDRIVGETHFYKLT